MPPWAAADAPDVREARDKTLAFLDEEGVAGLWPGLSERLFAPGVPADVVELAGSIALEQPTELLKTHVRAMRDRRDSTGLLPGISVPVLVRYGLTDVLVPPAHGAWLAANVPGCIVDVDDSAGHLGGDPEQEIAANARWLSAGIAPERSRAPVSA